MEKYHIEKNTVQETLVIPLYGRKMCSEQFPQLFRDETAIRQLVAQVKVLSKNEISVTLKSGIEIRQSISN